jgi:nucleotide-binding universal stress UspA family protein
MDLSGVPDVQTKVRYGHPAAKIVREAEEGDYALVVVGARQRRNSVERRLLGSTAIRVAEHAPGPVIVAKGTIRPIRHILLCDSGSMDPAVGLPSSASGTGVSGGEIPSVLSRFTELPLRLLNGAGEIVVMHVMSQMSAGPGVQGTQLRSDTDDLIRDGAPEGELLGRDIEALRRMGLRARAKVSRGLVVEEILGEAQRGDYDLVVIGAYRGQGWQRILLEDLAHRIVDGLDRPVLVVR